MDTSSEAISRRVNVLAKINALRWLAGAGLDWALIVVSFFFAAFFHTWWVYVLAALVIGNRQHALALLGHDGAHGLAMRPMWLNDLMSNLLCFWPFVMHLPAYRSFHFNHHRTVGTSKDPELENKYWSAPAWDFPTSRYAVWGYFLFDLTGLGILTYKRRAIYTLFQKKADKSFLRIAREGLGYTNEMKKYHSSPSSYP